MFGIFGIVVGVVVVVVGVIVVLSGSVVIVCRGCFSVDVSRLV